MKKIVVLGALTDDARDRGRRALAGGGLGSATTRQAFLNDAAKRLDVTPAELKAALEGAYDARLDAAVAAGKITKEQGAEAMKQRSAQSGLPLFGGGHHGGFGHHGAGLARRSGRPTSA